MLQFRGCFGLSFPLLALIIVPAELKRAVCPICTTTRCYSSPGVVGELDRCDASILLQAGSTALDVTLTPLLPAYAPAKFKTHWKSCIDPRCSDPCTGPASNICTRVYSVTMTERVRFSSSPPWMLVQPLTQALSKVGRSSVHCQQPATEHPISWLP